MTRKIAKLISFVLGMPWLAVIMYVLLHGTGLSDEQYRFFVQIFLIFSFIVPTSFFLWEYRHGEISDADITRRSERYKLLTLVCASNLVTLACAYVYGTPLLFHLVLSITLVLLAVYVITFFWKISLHMTFNVVGISMINITTNWQYMWLYALIPLIFWSRRLLRKHTPWQLVAGFAVSQAIVLGVAVWYGLA
jgi:hypothetical protein